MKHLVQLSIAGSLALGSVAAHANITVGTSSGSTGNVILFADIFNSTGTLVAAYAGDTGATVDSVGAGVKPGTTFDDANLQSFLSQATGNTVLWAVEGGGAHAGAVPYFVTSASSNTTTAITAIGQPSGNTLGQTFYTALTSQAQNINGVLSLNGTPTATSLLGTDDSALSGNGFNPLALSSNLANWGGGTPSFISSSGLGTVASLYTLTAANETGAAVASITPVLGVSLTANGLVYSDLGGGNPPPVPLPAAIWLLGSGLLGLAGIGRRKNTAA